MKSSQFFWLAGGLAAAVLLVLLTAPQESPTGYAWDAADLWPTQGEVTLLIDVDERLRPAARQEALALLPAQAEAVSRHAHGHMLYRVTLPLAEARELHERLEADTRIRTVEPEMEVELWHEGIGANVRGPGSTDADAPNDPLYAFQWNFDQIRVSPAWQRSQGEGVVVAVIDTGVAFADDEKSGMRAIRDFEDTVFVPGFDFVTNTPGGLDFHGHGTHVAGTIAQSTNNGYGVAGIAPRARIMPLRVLDASGRGSTGAIADSIRFAADNGAHIINMSLGGPLPSRVMADAIRYARRKGVVVIAAAGNNGWSMPSFPAAYAGVVAVAATQADRSTTFYSNYGRYIDIAAPGGNTRVDQTGDGRPDGVMQETLDRNDPSAHEFALYMGTSMASPHVAGVAALIRSTGVTHPSRIEEILLASTHQDVPNYERDRYGAGLLDADAATRATISRYQAPRAALVAFLGLFLLGMARLGTGLRALSPAALAGAAIATATGTSLLVLGLDVLPVVSGAWAAGFAGGPALWLAGTPAAGVASSALVLSALPVLGVYALFGSVRNATAAGLLVGFMLGFSAYLLGEGLVPLHDVTLIPGMGVLDRLWLVGNAAIACALTAAAARRAL